MGLIVLMVVTIIISFSTGYFICAFFMDARVCGNFLIDETNPDRTIFRIELTKDVTSRYVIFEVKNVRGLQSANDTDYIMEQ